MREMTIVNRAWHAFRWYSFGLHDSQRAARLVGACSTRTDLAGGGN